MNAIVDTFVFVFGALLFGGIAYSLWTAGRKKMGLLYCTAIPLFILDIYLAWMR